MPFSAATFLASGEALIRLLVVDTAATGSGTTSGAGSGAAGAGLSASATEGGFWLWSGCCDCIGFRRGRFLTSFSDSSDGTTDCDLVSRRHSIV